MAVVASGRDRLEVVTTLLLAVAAVATAWASYQATRWHGEQARAGSRTTALRIEAARAAGLAAEQTQGRCGPVHRVDRRDGEQRPELEEYRTAASAVVIGCVVFFGTALWMATFPVSISV